MTPDDWNSHSLEELIDVRHGFAFKGEYFNDEALGDILLTPGNFAIGGGYKADKLKYYRGPIPDDYVLQKGDLLVTMTDLSKASDTLGYPLLLPAPPKGRRFLHNQRLGKVELIADFPIERRFLYYLLRTRAYRHEVMASATGTTVKHTSPKRIRAFTFFLPPFHEQQNIAAVLGALDDKIELNRQMNETLEAIARDIFKSWFVDFDPVRAKMEGRDYPMDAETMALFPDSFEENELGLIPARWRVGSLGDVSSVKGGFAYKSKDFGTVGLPVIKIKNIQSDRTVDVFDLQYIPEELALQTEPFWLYDGDLVMAMTGATVGKFGLIVNKSEEPYSLLNQRVARFDPLKERGNLIWFVYCALLGNQLFEQLVSIAHGSAQPNISAKNIESGQLVIPDNPLIRRFNRLVNPMFETMFLNRRESNTLADLRDTLLPKLISGELRVPKAENVMQDAI